MNTRDIYNYITVARSESLSKAAQQLYITPQGLSKSIRNLEDELGVVLLIRTSKGIRLTGNGYKFLTVAEKLYEDMKELESVFDGKVDSVHGKIRISSALGILSNLTPEYLLSFNHIFPNIELRIKEQPDRFVEKDIEEGTADLGLAKEPVDHKKFAVYPIGEKRHCALVYRGHPLYEKDEISVEDLKNEKIIIENRDFKVYKKFVELCHSYGFEPDIYFETTEIGMAHRLAHLGNGIAISLETELESIGYENLKMVFFKEEFTCEWLVITKRTISPAVTELLRYLGINKPELFMSI